MKKTKLYELRKDEMSKLLVACRKDSSGNFVPLKRLNNTKTGDTIGIWTVPKDHWKRFTDKTNKEIIAAYPKLTADKIFYKPFKGTNPNGSDITILKEARTPEQIWQTTNVDLKTALQKIFRKYGWESDGYNSFEKEGYVAYVPTSTRGDNPYELKITNGGSKVELKDVPLELQDELVVIQDFLLTKLQPSKYGSGSYMNKPYSKTPEYQSPKQRVEPFKQGRKELAGIVPEEIFEDWWVSTDHNTSCSSDADDGVVTYSYTDEMSVTFQSKTNKEVYVTFGATLEAEGTANYRFYPGRMYMSNGDPGYPDEWDEDDVEFYDWKGSDEVEVCDWGEMIDDVSKEMLEDYAKAYVEKCMDDIEKNPEDYFYE